jgi:hypothetical protein
MGDSQMTAIKLLMRIYKEQGPGGKGNRKLPVSVYAQRSAEWIDKHYSFEDRHLMHEVAKTIVAARKQHAD